ncbi:hypothetical protein ACHAXT_008789 [Thalassiosira profunda]
MSRSRRPTHPLHLLDDLLASLSPGESGPGAPLDEHQPNDASSPNIAPTDAAVLGEAKQDAVLRAACDLFANNVSLLENALALLDEQEQYQRSCAESNNDDAQSAMPVLRRIRARRSGREAILVRKQRKKSSSRRRSKSADAKMEEDAAEAKPKQFDEYYLCLLGREQIDRRASQASNGGWARMHRKGMHCTCRSFFQNIKGGGRSSSSKSHELPSAPTCTDIVLCKHLLAAILMPHVLPWSGSGVKEEIVDDKEFAKLVVRASIG